MAKSKVSHTGCHDHCTGFKLRELTQKTSRAWSQNWWTNWMALNKFKSDGKPITNETEKQVQERNAAFCVCKQVSASFLKTWPFTRPIFPNCFRCIFAISRPIFQTKWTCFSISLHWCYFNGFFLLTTFQTMHAPWANQILCHGLKRPDNFLSFTQGLGRGSQQIFHSRHSIVCHCQSDLI